MKYLKFIIVLFLLSFCALSVRNFYTYSSWSIEKIEEFLGSPLPNDATNLEFSGASRGSKIYLLLSMEASPQSIEYFVGTFCNKPLLEGFDPFNAIYTIYSEGADSSNSFSLFRRFYEQGETVIYRLNAYSPESHKDIIGTYCENEDDAFSILIDRSSEIYRVQIEYNSICTPCNVNNLDARAIEHSPFVFRGLIDESYQDEKIFILRRTLCIELDPSLPAEMIQDYVGSQVYLYIDRQVAPVAVGVVSMHGQLENEHYDDTAENSHYFEFCYIPRGGWGERGRSILITIVKGTGYRENFRRSFGYY